MIKKERDGDERPVGDARASVIAALSRTTGGLTHVNLRDVRDEHVTPVVMPKGPDAGDLPEQIDRYQLQGEIARGGVGVIYKARDVDLGRELALKVLLESHRDNPVMARRFIEEAQIGGQLQHPGIMCVHDMGLVAPDKPYFTMKLVKGQTLAALLDARKDPAEDRLRFLGIFEQVAETLAYAHARKVIHRDLKPANIMVGAFGEVQVMDWGLAKVLGHEHDPDREAAEKARTQISVIETIRSGSAGSDSLAGSVLGTPAYMAPEQARGEVDDLDPRADVFGLGAILCEILTGKPPYVAGTVKEVHLQAKRGYLDEALERLDQSTADPELVDLAKRCLAYEPRERPPDGQAVTRAIHGYLESLEERTRRATLEAAEARVRAAGQRRARRLSLALAGVVIAVLSLGAMGYVWIDGLRRARLHDASVAATRALEEALEARALARASGLLDLPKWQAAMTAAEEASSVASGARSDLRERASQLLSDVTVDVERARRAKNLDERNRRLLEQLEELRGDHADDSSYSRNEPGYAEAFRQYGIDIDALEPEDAAARLRESGIAIELAETLDHWGKSRKSARPRDPEGWKKLFRISRLLDPDPWRQRLRRAHEHDDLDAMRRLVASPGLMNASARTLELLGTSLRQAGDGASAEWVYRVARDLYPTDFWINHDRHRFLRREPFHLAALASRPRSGHAWGDARTQITSRDSPRDSVAAYAYWMTRGSVWACERLVSVLGEPSVEAEDLGGVIDGLVLRLERDLRSDAGNPRVAARALERAWSLRPELVPASRILEIAQAQVRSSNGKDADALALLAAVHWRAGENADAIRVLERAVRLPEAPPSTRRLLEQYRQATLPDLVTHGSIDAFIAAPDEIVREGDVWRFFRGLRQPAPGIAWTGRWFDDRDWEEGPSGFGYGDNDDGTVIDGMRYEYTALFVRRVVEIPEPGRYERLVLSVRYDDGFVVYLNGQEIGRENAPGQVGEPLPLSAVAVVQIEPTDSRPIVLPRERLIRGKNIIALHGLNTSASSSDFSLIPVLRGELTREAATARGRFADFFAAASGPDAAARVAYIEGRISQESGKHAEAVPHLRRAVELDGRPGSPEPVTRLASSLRALGDATGAEEELRRYLEGGGEASGELLALYGDVSRADLGRSWPEIVGRLPEQGKYSIGESGADWLWALREIDTAGVLRINCAGDGHEDRRGRRWSPDRLFTGGRAHATVRDVIGSEDDDLFSTHRFFPGGPGQDDRRAGYRVPVADGGYEVSLHFADTQARLREGGSRIFDVLLEDWVVLEAYDATATVGWNTLDSRKFLVWVDDGFLDIALRRRPLSGAPMLAAFEIRPLEGETAAEAARLEVERTGRTDARALALLGQALFASGAHREAMRVFEEAAELPGFAKHHGEFLQRQRAALVPDLVTHASIDAAVESSTDPAQDASLAAFRRSASGDDAAARLAYLDGRLLALAGEHADALREFESVLESGPRDPEPHLRAAQCERALGNAAAAEARLRSALARGVRPSRELMSFLLDVAIGDLGKTGWEALDGLPAWPLELPVVPTSERSAQLWRYTETAPPEGWKEPDFDASSWELGPAGFGDGDPGPIRTAWTSTRIWLRRDFTLERPSLVNAYLDVKFDEDAEVWINGRSVATLPGWSHAEYWLLPLDDGSVFRRGRNTLAVSCRNAIGWAFIDVGIVDAVGDAALTASELRRAGALRINCGGAEHRSPRGVTWLADRCHSPGAVHAGAPGEIRGTRDDAIFLTQRSFPSVSNRPTGYQIPLPPGRYQVTLHFAEIILQGAGARVFDVRLEGQPVLEGYDAVREAGFRSADSRRFTVEVGDGRLDIDLVHGPAQDPMLAAIEIVPAD